MPTILELHVALLEELLPALVEHDGPAAAFAMQWPPPSGPGVYVWATPDDAVAYIGSAASLATRLGRERSWIDGHDPETEWEVTVVHMLKRLSAMPHWYERPSHADAVELERRLIEWHRALTGVAPIIVGWDAKKGSPTSSARRWAQQLWASRHSI